MRQSRALLVTCLVFWFTLVSCASLSPHKEAVWDKPYVKYPRYRIDHMVHKICIIGTGERKEEISSFLTTFFMEQTEVKVIEPGNLEAVLKGRVLEYGTGLTPNEAQILSQMFQVDHVFVFHEKVSPHEDYRIGGRQCVRIHLKLYNTRDGEIIFQDSHEIGRYLPDPRPKYSSYIEEKSVFDTLRRECLSSLGHKLEYAFGGVRLGIAIAKPVEGFGCVIPYICRGSLAYRAGLKQGDRVIGINTVEVRTPEDAERLIRSCSQGDSIKIKVERDGNILELEAKFPTIPKYPAGETATERKPATEI